MKKPWHLISLAGLMVLGGFQTVWGQGFFAKSAPASEGQYYRNRADTVGYEDGLTFAVPSDLQHAVEFWKTIYTEYTTKQSLIHDSKYLQVMYTAIDFTELYANTQIPDATKRRMRERKEEEIKEKYRAILRRLEQVDLETLSLQSLSGEEKRVYRLFEGIQEEYRFERSSQRLRSQVGQRNEFIRGIVDSGAFIREMEDIFASYRLPVQLVRIAFVESMFNTKAYSKAHASGIWQFIPSTGKQYLRIDAQVDERNDPILATHASARLLLENYQTLEAWPLAITAYNHGRAGMKQAVTRVGEKNLGTIISQYNHPNFGFASRNFYAQFLAALDCERNFKKYFGPLVRMQPVQVEKVRLPAFVTLKTLSDYGRIPEDELIELNPALTDAVINSLVFLPKDYDLKIPMGSQQEFLTAYANIPEEYRHTLQGTAHWHRVGRHEVLSQIAGRYKMTVGSLMQANGLTTANRIYVGQLLRIPSKNAVYAKSPVPPPKQVVLARAPKAEVHYPSVKVLPLQLDEIPDEPEVETTLVSAASIQPVPERSEPTPARDPLSPAEQVAQGIFSEEETSLTPRPVTFASLFSLIDPQNNQKAFSLVSSSPQDLEKISWNFHYDFRNKNRDEDVPFAGSTVILDGETPGHLAEWCRISTPQFRRLNLLKFGQAITLGQNVKLECLSTFHEFHQERLGYHQETQKEYFKDCPSLRFEEHQVHAHESLWEIANTKYQTPVWLIQKYNPTKDLTENLHPGEALKIPICIQSPASPGSETS